MSGVEGLAVASDASNVAALRSIGKKANLSLDAGLLEAIDDAAKASGLTRSSFVATAAREKITHAS
jgi:uncharacterized protein (DUF1778 family)